MKNKLEILPLPQKWISFEEKVLCPSESSIFISDLPKDMRLHIGNLIQTALAWVGVNYSLTGVQHERENGWGVDVRILPECVSHRQGYVLTIDKTKVSIIAHDPSGVFYAAMTLRQIARQYRGTGKLPCLRIEDWPDFPNRGVMLDISRDKVPQMETLYALIEMLAEWKINQIQLYTEHTFAFRNHREVWQWASPMTGEEILKLDDFCKRHFVELVPNQNSFGHMERWLKHKRYQHLAENLDGFTFPWGTFHEGPFSLCPVKPGAIKLLSELYDELLPHFSSRQFNVGCDETFDLGQGKSKAACEEKGTGRVYLDFFYKIHHLVEKHGKIVQFWGDIILKHPELISALPHPLIALDWGYEADHPFDEEGKQFAESGVPFYVCPGTSSWLSIAGRTDNALKNLWCAAKQGLLNGAIGYLITDWGDCGHWQHLPISFPAFAYGASVSWATQKNRLLDVSRVINRHAFQDDANAMGEMTLNLGNAYQHTGILLKNRSVLAMLLLFPDRPLNQGELQGLSIQALEKTDAYIHNTLSLLWQSSMKRQDEELIMEEFKNTAALLQHACLLGIARLKTRSGLIEDIPRHIRLDLAEDLESIIKDYKKIWLARNREGGLADSVGRMEALFNKYVEFIKKSAMTS